MLSGAGWGSVLRGGIGQLKADGNIGLAADGPCADPQRGEFQRSTVFLCAATLLVHSAEQSLDIGIVRFDSIGFCSLIEKRHIGVRLAASCIKAELHLPHHGRFVTVCFAACPAGQAVRAAFLGDVGNSQRPDGVIVFPNALFSASR